MALKLGSLFVSLDANATGLTKGLAEGAKAIEKFSRQAKAMAGELAASAGALTIIGAAAVKLAASVDGRAKAAMTGLENSTKLLAVQVADVLLPAVKALTQMFDQAARIVAGLDGETRKTLSTVAVIAVQMAAAAKAVQLFAGVVGPAMKALSTGLSLVASVGLGPLLAIVATVAAVIGIVLLLHRAWRKNWGGIQQATQSVVEWLRNAFSQLGSFFGKFWDSLITGAENFVAAVLEAVDALQQMTGVKLVDVDAMREGFTGLFKDLRSGEFFSEAFKFGQMVAEKIGDGLGELVDEAKVVGKQVKDALGLDALLKGGTPRAPSGIETVQVSTVGGDTSGAKGLASGFAPLQGPTEGLPQAHIITAWDKFAAFSDEVTNRAMSAMGSAGASIQNIVSGFAQGGPIGGIVSVALELVTRMKSFQDLMGMLEKAFGRIAEFVDGLLSGIFDAVGMILAVVIESLKPLFDSLAPLFQAIAVPLKGIAPILALLGFLFQAIAPLLVSIGTILGALFKALEPVLKILFEIVKVVMVVIIGFLQAVVAIWNTIIDVIAAIVQGILTAITLGAGASWAKDVADGIRKAKADDKALGSAMNALNQSTWDSMMAQSAAAAASYKLGDGLDDLTQKTQQVTEALTNVPSGYKIAYARFQSDMGLNFAANTANAGGGGGDFTFTGDIYINTSGDGEDTLEAMRAAARKEAAQRRGNPYARGDLGDL